MCLGFFFEGLLGDAVSLARRFDVCQPLEKGGLVIWISGRIEATNQLEGKSKKLLTVMLCLPSSEGRFDASLHHAGQFRVARRHSCLEMLS